jgi:hypothetical protein
MHVINFAEKSNYLISVHINFFQYALLFNYKRKGESATCNLQNILCVIDVILLPYHFHSRLTSA